MTSNITTPIASVFESFNARSLPPERVAKTFIAPSSFVDLAARCHSTVVGPRGSGKTTVLKMLQPSALEAWQSEDGKNYRTRIDYTGVFVPTDISWNKQTLAIVEGLQPNLTKLFRGAAFTAHVLHELLDVMTWRTENPSLEVVEGFRRVSLSPADQRRIVKQLAASWSLQPDTETLLGLKHSLAGRLVEIWSLAQRASLVGIEPQSLPTWLTLEFLSCCQQAVELYDDAVGERQARWALLFDELELAPEWIMQGLLTALRSTADKFLFKLAVSPFNERYDALKSALQAMQAMPDQDFNEIRLWHAHKEEGFDFSERLFLSICRDYGINVASVSEVVRRSFLEAESSSPAAYVKRSRHYRVLARGLRSDPSFARYWKESGVDLDKIASLDEEVRAAKVRKIYPLVVIRNFFRAPAGSRQAKQQVRKGRKSMEVYSGATSILTISEANPRWIIGLTRLLLSSKSALQVRRSEQARQIESTIHKFRARLKTISLGNANPRIRARTVLDLLDRIGMYFQQSVIQDDFHPQPTLTFTVDSHASPDLVNAIGRAINAGALVYVPDKSSVGILNDVKGKRFRLSYLLAPHYQLPLRLGGSVSLSRILSGGRFSDSNQAELLAI
jgi:hypothetical protein